MNVAPQPNHLSVYSIPRLRQKNRPRAYLDDGNFKAPNGSSSRILGLLGGMANLARISSRGSWACWKKSTSRSRSLLQAAPRATASAIHHRGPIDCGPPVGSRLG